MNDSVKNELKDICSYSEYEAVLKMVYAVESLPEKKQKEAVKDIIDEVVQ